jgi:hypothetical protein
MVMVRRECSSLADEVDPPVVGHRTILLISPIQDRPFGVRNGVSLFVSPWGHFRLEPQGFALRDDPIFWFVGVSSVIPAIRQSGCEHRPTSNMANLSLIGRIPESQKVTVPPILHGPVQGEPR